MKLKLTLPSLGFACLMAAASSENCTFEEIAPSSTLIWCPCNNGFACAKLDVPLDYYNPCLGRASIPLLKYPATKNSLDGVYQGQLLLNPGGPGASGINMALSSGALIQSVLGSNWDVVGFDTRGMWLSEPVADCSLNSSTIQNSNLKARSVPRLSDDFFTDVINYGKELGKRCEETIGGQKDVGPHMSTAIVTRDMLSITQAFAETDDGNRASKPSHLLNYYGISYGTFLGQTFASMFPENVGNMVLDGVVSPEGYLTNYTSQFIIHLDGIIAAFFIYCKKAGPSLCSYDTGSTPKDVYDRFNQSFIQLDPKRAENENWSNATDIEEALLLLKNVFLTYANSPLEYFSMVPPALLSLEDALASHNIRLWTEQMIKSFGDPTLANYASANPQWSLGTMCSDQNNTMFNKTMADLRPLTDYLSQTSIIGEMWIHAELGCWGWSIKANEIFTGPFGSDTATPILFVDNTYDPVTPIENGRSSAPKYKDVQILTIDGMGHTIIATQNTCAFGKLRAYFQDNIMPGNDSFCPLEIGPFGIVLNGTLEENLLQAGLLDLVK